MRVSAFVFITSCILCVCAVTAQVPAISFVRSGQATTASGVNLSSSDVVSDPNVIFDNGLYRVWYTSVNGAYTEQQVMGITYAESTDGIIWSPRLNPATGEPTLMLTPTAGRWDARGVETASVVKTPNGKYWMYYSGDLSTGRNTWAIGLAQSNDGITWTKVGTGPVLSGRGAWEGPFIDGVERTGGVCEPAVIYDAARGIFRMWYAALGYRFGVLAYRVGYATSVDGISWTARSTPVLEPGAGAAWNNLVVSQVNVVQDPKTGFFHLFFFGASGDDYVQSAELGAASASGHIGYAFSKDGIVWQQASVPALSPVPSTWEQWTVAGPSALIQSGVIKLWYHASSSYDTYAGHFGLATAQIPN